MLVLSQKQEYLLLTRLLETCTPEPKEPSQTEEGPHREQQTV